MVEYITTFQLTAHTDVTYLTFVKRIGTNYPGNDGGGYCGTTT